MDGPEIHYPDSEGRITTLRPAPAGHTYLLRAVNGILYAITLPKPSRTPGNNPSPERNSRGIPNS